MTTGVLLAIGSAAVFALGQVAIRKAIGTLGVAFGTAVMLIAGAIVVTIAALVLDGSEVLFSATRAAFLIFVVTGVIHFLGGWAFVNASTKLIGVARMSAIVGISPLFAAILAIIFLSESLNAVMGGGILLIMAGTYFVATG